VISCRKIVKKEEVKEQVREEVEDSKEVQDLEKASPPREEAHDGEKNKSYPFDLPRNNQMKHYVLRINPIVMKRHRRGISVKKDALKKKKNLDEVLHIENTDETLVSILLLDEDESVQPCFPPAHKEVISHVIP
jgi:hypothetical protein